MCSMRFGAAVAAVLIATAGHVQAATITTYTSRIAFDAAVGATTLEDFNSILAEVPFHTSPVDIGDFVVSMTGSPITFIFNFIDIPPAAAETDVNGTTDMRVLTDSGATLVFTFDSPTMVFGADLRSINDSINRTRLNVDGDLLALPIAGASGLFSFFGFESDTPFTTLLFEGVAGDAYGIDNVSFAPVPEPSTLTLAGGLGLIGLMAYGWRRRGRA